MILNFEYFTKAAPEVERIINLPESADLKTALRNASNGVDEKYLKEYYLHMNSLFLNIILNRVQELGKEAEERAFTCREIIVELIKNIR